jgi:class 3 adenylate cyclase/ABC-type branched-subunit amino acid transport system substrate-binding protein
MAIEHGGTITRGFLFADLRGYTDYVEQRGAAAAAALLTQYRKLVREAIGQFNGAEIKTEGDSFYVVFDSVSNAVRCGLAITAAAKAEDEPIAVGVGIHAGEAIEADGAYIGSPVNIAARICAQAGPGEVWVSETVRAIMMSLLPVTFKSRGRRELKGIADPIELFAVKEAADPTTAWRTSRRPRRLSRRARFALAAGVLALIAVAAGLGWLASRPHTGLPSGPFTIGVHVPLSGVGASWGVEIRNAVQLAVDQRSKDGALADVELGVKAFDTAANRDDPFPESPARSAAAVRKLTGDPRTIAAVGPFTSPNAERTIPITNRAGLLECSPSNSMPELTKPDKGALELRKASPDRINYVRLSTSSDVEGRALASFAAHDLNAESALVITGQTAAELAPDFVDAFTALGGQVATARLAIVSVPPRRGRSNAELARLFDAARVADARKQLSKEVAPDVVVVAGGTEDARAVKKAMRDLGLASIPLLSWDTIYNGSGRVDSSYLQRTGKDAVGTYAGLTSIAPPSAAFVDAYRARFRKEPSDYASAAYACTQVILAALAASAKDGPSAAGLKEAVRARAVDSSNRYDTVLGTLGFDENGDSTQQVISFYRVDPEGADGAGDWALIKQQDFGQQPS